jgi:hypothetical protein
VNVAIHVVDRRELFKPLFHTADCTHGLMKELPFASTTSQCGDEYRPGFRAGMSCIRKVTES